jgi:hypothetical protein
MEFDMKTEEDEAFDDIARRQGGGFPAKRTMAADKQEPWNEDEWRKNNWRCHHGWLRGEQCEICNAPPAPQHPWVGLTDDELADLWYKESLDWMEFARAVEQLLKEKNNGT